MQNESYTALIIGAGSISIAFFIMLVFVVSSVSKRKILVKENTLRELERKQQVELFRATAESGENEKAKIASNLHDEVIPLLAFTARSLNNHITELDKKGIEVTEMKRDMVGFTQIADRVRDIAHDLIPKLFNSFGLIKSIESVLSQMNSGKESAAEFQNNTVFSGDLPFSKSEQLIIYRICLEILNNLSKHSKYDYLKVTLEDMKKSFTIVFAHDGKGITNEEIAILREKDIGIGLKSLESRIIVLGAQLDYSVDGDVSFVKLVVPLKK